MVSWSPGSACKNTAALGTGRQMPPLLSFNRLAHGTETEQTGR